MTSATRVPFGAARVNNHDGAFDSGGNEWRCFPNGKILYVNTEAASYVDEVISIT